MKLIAIMSFNKRSNGITILTGIAHSFSITKRSNIKEKIIKLMVV
jgi:hypothetical protein